MRALLDALRSMSRRDVIALAIEFGAVGLLFSGAVVAAKVGEIILSVPQ
ncbi:hypothetical protein [Kaistia algarum]|nr:hypothetical protein [Kaistia algarum]MCX5512240.1 hypothetical protein [Kaistia algarum]